MELVEASLQVEKGLVEFLEDLGRGENGFTGPDVRDPDFDLTEYLRAQERMARGIGLKPGLVAQTTYWLLDETAVVVGMSKLRHRLTPPLLFRGGHIGYYVKRSERGKGYGTLLLRGTLEQAGKLGIDRVLVTADSTNELSLRVIVANGGEFEDERYDPEEGCRFRRFWIDTAPGRAGRGGEA